MTWHEERWTITHGDEVGEVVGYGPIIDGDLQVMAVAEHEEKIGNLMRELVMYAEFIEAVQEAGLRYIDVAENPAGAIEPDYGDALKTFAALIHQENPDA